MNSSRTSEFISVLRPGSAGRYRAVLSGCFIWLALVLLMPSHAWGQAPRMMINPQGHSAKIHNLLFTPDGKQIISISEDKTIGIWNTKSGSMEQRLAGEIGDGWSGMLYASALSPDGSLLAVAGYPAVDDGTNYVMIIELKSRKQIATANGHTDVINALAFTPDGQGLLSASNDGTIIYWKVSRDKEWRRQGTIQAGAPVSSFTINRVTHDVAVACGNKDIKVFGLKDMLNPAGMKARLLQKHQGNVRSVIYSHDGQHLASSSDKNELIVWTADGSVEFNRSKLPKSLHCMAFSPDSKILAAFDDEGKGATWSVQSGHLFTAFEGHKKAVSSVAFIPGQEGNYMVASVGGINNEIILWNGINGSTIQVLSGNGSSIRNLRFGENLKLFITQYAKTQNRDSVTCFDFGRMGIALEADASMVPIAEISQTVQTGPNQLMTATGMTVNTDPDTDGRLLSHLTMSNGGVVVASDFSLKMFSKNGALQKEFVGHGGAVRALSLSQDQRYLASGGEDQVVIIWNLSEEGMFPTLSTIFPGDEWKSLFSLIHADSLSRTPSRAAWQETIKRLRTGNKKLYRDIEAVYNELGEKIIPFSSLFLSTDHEWVCWNPSGYFNCTPTGVKYFGWHVNKSNYELGEHYDADQYYDVLFRPEEMTQSMVTGKRVETIMVEQGKRIFDFHQLKKPSAAFFQRQQERSDSSVRLHNGRLLTSLPTVTLAVDIYDGGGGIKELNIYRNDKLVLVDREINTKAFHDKLSKSYTLDMTNDVNVFKVKVINYQKVESRPDIFTVEYDGEPITTSVLYILSVGINKYQNTEYTLNYAQPDAESFANKLKEKSARIFKRIEHKAIYDGNATKENIMQSFRAISAQAKPEDLFMFYYAGHGILDEERDDSEYYLVPADVTKIYGDSHTLAQKALSASELKDMLTQVKCQKQLVLMDACQSGSAVAFLRTRAAGMDEKAIKQLARASGVAIMASSGTKQKSIEFDALKHGAFTYALLEALDGKFDNNDSQLTVQELNAFMTERVPQLSKEYGGRAQSPSFFFDGDDFPISVY